MSHNNKPSTDQDYRDDPYSAFITDVVRAINLADANRGAMSDWEFDTLKTLKGVTRRCDPDTSSMMDSPERDRGERGKNK